MAILQEAIGKSGAYNEETRNLYSYFAFVYVLPQVHPVSIAKRVQEIE
jgi:hypothetical protein